ncbi:MAG: hypothetical protein GX241_07320, partial [Ruminococcaceae bacterium]|nr:hypothetical protein [Oscillospiraceae bacterium]
AYSINDNKLYIGNGSSVVRVDAGSYTAECSTAAATGAKTVNCAGFILFKGVEITVKFTVTNTAPVNTLTLKVGSTDAKPIRYRNAYLLSPSTLSKNRVYKFYYGGDYWELIGDLDIDTTVATELASHTSDTDNPHAVTKSQVGLGNVLNVASYSKTESDTSIANAISAIEIGGRNLIIGSFNDWRSRTVSTYGYSSVYIPIQDDWRGKTVTHSFEVKDIPEGESVRIRIDYYRPDTTYTTSYFGSIVSLSGKSYVTYTVTTDTQYNRIRARIFPVNYTSNYNVLFRSEKLEFGNKATDWTPAPEDQVSDWNESSATSFSFIKNKPTQLSQFTDNIGVATHIASTSNPHTVTTAQIGAVDLTTNQTIAGAKTFTGNVTAPTFTASSTIQATTAKLTNLSNGYLPYHVSDASGLANSVIFTDGTNVGIGYTAPGSYRLKVNGSGYFNSNLTVGGTLGVTGATTLTTATVTNQLNFGSSGKWINLHGSASLHDITAFNLSIKHDTPFIDFYFDTIGVKVGDNWVGTSRIIESAAGVLDIQASVKIPSTKYWQIGNAKFTYETVDGVGFLKLAHSDGTTPMHLVTTGGQTMYSTGVPAAGGGGGATVILNGVTTENAVFWAPTSAGTQGQYLIFNNGLPTWANFPTTWAWSALTGVPDTFTPSAHTHDDRYYTETEINNFFAGSTALTGYNKSNWDTAYGWGNHASAGYAAAYALSSHTGNTSNPHSVTKSQVGLGNVLNVASYSKAESDGRYLPFSGGTLTGDLSIRTGNTDKYITFDYSGNNTYNWRIGYLGTGTGDANYFTIQSSKSTGGVYFDALRLGLETLNAQFFGTVTAPTFSGSLSGNASTATTLATAREINGTSFNGSANITTARWGTARNIGVVNSDGTGTAVTTSVNGSANVNLKLPSTIKASLTGNASTATKLQTARTIAGVSFDGTANINIPFANLASKPTTLAGYGITDAYTKAEVDGLAKYIGGYSYSNGFLVKTNVARTENSMLVLHIKGNSYGGRVPINTLVQVYNYVSSDAIINTGALNNGYKINEVKAFYYDNLVYFWVPQQTSFMTMTFQLLKAEGQVNRVVSVSNSAVPTTGVEKMVTITPRTAWFEDTLTNLSQLTDNIGVASHIANTSNPHNVTKAQVGLGNVDNTADSAKNVLSATKLTTARTINGTSFNGTANITTANWGTARNIGIVNSDGTGTAVTTSVNGSANVNLKLPATIKASLTGNASTATKLQTARTIAGVSFDGTANINIPFANLA